MADLNTPQQMGSGDLACECGSREFLRVLTLAWHRDGGTSEKPVGLRCQKCDKVSTTQEMIKRLQIKLKKEELESLEGSIREELKSL